MNEKEFEKLNIEELEELIKEQEKLLKFLKGLLRNEYIKNE